MQSRRDKLLSGTQRMKTSRYARVVGLTVGAGKGSLQGVLFCKEQRRRVYTGETRVLEASVFRATHFHAPFSPRKRESTRETGRKERARCNRLINAHTSGDRDERRRSSRLAGRIKRENEFLN